MYRKSDEKYYWLGKECFDDVYRYLLSLKTDNEVEISRFLNNKKLNDIFNDSKSVDLKPFMELNTK